MAPHVLPWFGCTPQKCMHWTLTPLSSSAGSLKGLRRGFEGRALTGSLPFSGDFSLPSAPLLSSSASSLPCSRGRPSPDAATHLYTSGFPKHDQINVSASEFTAVQTYCHSKRNLTGQTLKLRNPVETLQGSSQQPLDVVGHLRGVRETQP